MATMGQNEMKPSDGMPLRVRLSDVLGVIVAICDDLARAVPQGECSSQCVADGDWRPEGSVPSWMRKRRTDIAASGFTSKSILNSKRAYQHSHT
jgi:hypothetical protein